MENNPAYSDKQRQLYKDRQLEYRKTEKAGNTITKSKRSSNESLKDQTNS